MGRPRKRGLERGAPGRLRTGAEEARVACASTYGKGSVQETHALSSGQDRWREACGLFGVGAIFDLDGDDTYVASESGLGVGWYGTGLLMDFSGDDDYAVEEHWGQGAAHAGVGMLVDLEGNDQYICGYESQGLGSTYGAGVLVDVSGNDRYVARDDGNISELYNFQSVSMSQGVGYGRRADLGPRLCLAARRTSRDAGDTLHRAGSEPRR